MSISDKDPYKTQMYAAVADAVREQKSTKAYARLPETEKEAEEGGAPFLATS